MPATAIFWFSHGDTSLHPKQLEEFLALIQSGDHPVLWSPTSRVVVTFRGALQLEARNFPPEQIETLRARMPVVKCDLRGVNEGMSNRSTRITMEQAVRNAMLSVGTCQDCGLPRAAQHQYCPRCGSRSKAAETDLSDVLRICRVCTDGEAYVYHHSYRVCPRCGQTLKPTKYSWFDFVGMDETEFLGDGVTPDAFRGGTFDDLSSDVPQQP